MRYILLNNTTKERGKKTIKQVDNKEYNKRDYIDFSIDWLQIGDYELKILILTSVLEDVDLAFNGNLKTMCEWLGIKSTPNNNNNIKQAIENLSSSSYIEFTKKGQKYIITVTDKGKENNKIIAIRKCWVETFKNYKEQVKNVSIGWINLLKVFVYICSKNKHIFTQNEIAKELNISIRTVATALQVISQCKLQGLKIFKDRATEEYKDFKGNKFIYNIGTEIIVGMEFE